MQLFTTSKRQTIISAKVFICLTLIFSCNPNQATDNEDDQSNASSKTSSAQQAGTTNKEIIKIGDEIFEFFKNEDFKSIVDRFDASLKVYLDEPRLKATWETLELQAGQLKEKGDVSGRNTADFEEALVQFKFEKVDLYLRLVINKENKIVGLFFQPTKI